MHSKILFARIGWGERYEGEDLTGTFREPMESGSWWDRFNFMSGPGQVCYGYIPPLGAASSPPKPSDPADWLVIFCSKAGLKLRPVGWYERATLERGYIDRPENPSLEPQMAGQWDEMKFNVSTSAKHAYCIPLDNRNRFPSIPTTVFKRAYMYASGHDNDRNEYVTLAENIVSMVHLADRISEGVPSPRSKGDEKDGETLNKLLEDLAELLQQKGEFETDDLEDARERTLSSIVRRLGQPEFRKSLLLAYEGKCAVSGFDCVDTLEAAHIYPYCGSKTNHVTNGILLRSDIHTLFDLGKISINADTYTIAISKDLKGTAYAKLDGSTLTLPCNPAMLPNKAALRKAMKVRRPLA